MDFCLLPLNQEDIPAFKKDMQEAFQNGEIKGFINPDDIILPEKDIDESLSKKRCFCI